jgi:hypothetical protein
MDLAAPSLPSGCGSLSLPLRRGRLRHGSRGSLPFPPAVAPSFSPTRTPPAWISRLPPSPLAVAPSLSPSNGRCGPARGPLHRAGAPLAMAAVGTTSCVRAQPARFCSFAVVAWRGRAAPPPPRGRGHCRPSPPPVPSLMRQQNAMERKRGSESHCQAGPTCQWL